MNEDIGKLIIPSGYIIEILLNIEYDDTWKLCDGTNDTPDLMTGNKTSKFIMKI